MRTILFLTQSNSSAALAKRIQELGDRVIFEHDLFEGSLFNPEVFRRVIRENPELVIMDQNFEASSSAKLEFEKAGIPVYGSSLLSKSASTNPDYLRKIMKVNGIKTEPAPTSTIPMTYSVVLNGKDKVSSALFYEYKHFLNGNLGPEVCMGSIGYFGDLSTIDERMESLIAGFLKSGFRGNIDFLLRFDKEVWCEGVHFYFRWNTLYAMLENINMNPSEFFYQVSMNSDMKIKFKSNWSCQINCGVPPFPYQLGKDEIAKIDGINSDNSKHLWILNFDNGELLSATGRGKYIREAKRRAYRTLSNIQAKDMMYRTDIGLDTADEFRKLRDLKWIDIKEEELVEPYQKAGTLQ